MQARRHELLSSEPRPKPNTVPVQTPKDLYLKRLAYQGFGEQPAICSEGCGPYERGYSWLLFQSSRQEPQKQGLGPVPSGTAVPSPSHTRGKNGASLEKVVWGVQTVSPWRPKGQTRAKSPEALVPGLVSGPNVPVPR